MKKSKKGLTFAAIAAAASAFLAGGCGRNESIETVYGPPEMFGVEDDIYGPPEMMQQRTYQSRPEEGVYGPPPTQNSQILRPEEDVYGPPPEELLEDPDTKVEVIGGNEQLVYGPPEWFQSNGVKEDEIL